jgi:hypothetical protein
LTGTKFSSRAWANCNGLKTAEGLGVTTLVNWTSMASGTWGVGLGVGVLVTEGVEVIVGVRVIEGVKVMVGVSVMVGVAVRGRGSKL